MRNLLHDQIIPIGDPPPSLIQRFYWVLAGRCGKCGKGLKNSKICGRYNKRYEVHTCDYCGYIK